MHPGNEGHAVAIDGDRRYRGVLAVGSDSTCKTQKHNKNEVNRHASAFKTMILISNNAIFFFYRFCVN